MGSTRQDTGEEGTPQWASLLSGSVPHLLLTHIPHRPLTLVIVHVVQKRHMWTTDHRRWGRQLVVEGTQHGHAPLDPVFL